MPLLPNASDPDRHGFVRIINHADRAGEIRIHAIDDAGNRVGPLTLAIDADETLHVNSDDVENGNAVKGLDAGAGRGNGDWRLELESDLDIEVLAYIRTTDGFLASMHDVVALGADGQHRVALFNPGVNADQASRLRVINANGEVANVTISAVDDSGAAPVDEVQLAVPADATRTLSAHELESGGAFDGALGNGTGKWQLFVSSDVPITVMNLIESPTGYLANLSRASPNVGAGGAHVVPLFPASTDAFDRQGFVRVINHSAKSGSVTIYASDADQDYGPITLTLGSEETAHFNSDDLELGNPGKGLSGGIGAGRGDWRLRLSSDLDIEALAYIRSKRDGFLTAMHDLVPYAGPTHRVAVFNPASNQNQVSQLLLENRGTAAARVTISGIDDHGTSPGEAVGLFIPAGASRTLTAQELEAGSDDFGGGLGDGSGKWRLVVESDTPIRVLNLLASPTGHLANLSSVPANVAPDNESAFNDRAIGKRIVEGNGANYIDFVSRGRFRETRGARASTGSYTYASTGESTGTLAMDYDDGDPCTAELAFETRESGRLSSCREAADTELRWRLLEPSRRDGERTVHDLSAVIAALPSGEWTPDVVRDAVASTANGVVRLTFDNHGYVEIGGRRYTCRDAGGCVIDNQAVTSGRVVETPASAASDFDLIDANGSPAGLTYGNGNFYLVDAADDKVYGYDKAGRHMAALDFDLAAETDTPGGIALGDGRFYVVDELDFLDEFRRRPVFVYDSAGQHVGAADFELSAGVREPLGIAYANGSLFVVDAWTERVYAYRTSGERDPDAEFDLHPDNDSPRGIAYGKDRFYVADIGDNKVYVYRETGHRDVDAEFALAGGNTLARGIAYVDGSFYVADADRVFAYPSDRPDLVVNAFSVDDTRPGAGESFELRATVRNEGYRRSATTTLFYYRSTDATISERDDEIGSHVLNSLAVAGGLSDSLALVAPERAGFYYYGVCVKLLADESRSRNCSDAVEVTVPVDIKGPGVGFALDTDNRNPTGIAYAQGRFHVLDFQDDRVYAYRTTAARDPDSDFALDPDSDLPVTITSANERFYVVDGGDDKVYAYHVSGERDADADFDLDADNQTPSAVAYGNALLFVADRSDDKVYAYKPSGQRDADADFDLLSSNDFPWGMEYVDDQLYVLDLLDDHVYVYSTSGQREADFEFNLVPDNSSPDGLAFINGRFYVTDSSDDTVYGYAIRESADFAVETLSVSDSSPGPEGPFTLTATVTNLGEAARATTLRFYMSSDSSFSAEESLAGTRAIATLAADATVDVSIELTAPADDGCYFCGACVDAVSRERVTSNNCAKNTDVLVGEAPDLDVSRLQIHTPSAVGEPVEVEIGVINRGAAASLPGKLRFEGGDDVVIDIPALAPNEEKIYQRQKIGTAVSGTTTYEICMDVPCEGNPDDNCRTRQVTL